jgi:lysophospholipase L1-like esterase
MSDAFDAFSGGSVTGTTLTVAHTIGAGSNRLLVTSVFGDAADVVTGATYNGVAMTLVDKVNSNPGVDRWLYCFVLENPASGSHNIVVTASTSITMGASSASYSGVVQIGQPEASAHNSDPNAAGLTTSVTTLTDNAWTVLCTISTGGHPAAGTNSTKRGDDNFGGVGISAIFDSNGAISPPASHSMSFTCTTGPVGGIIVSIAPVGAVLTSGTASLTSATNAAISVDGGTALGGTAPYAYQWYRSTTANFTPGGGNLLAGATGATLADSASLLADTPYFYIRRVTDSVAATADTNQVAGVLKAAPVIVYFLGDSITLGTSGPTPPADTFPALFAVVVAHLYKQRVVTAVNGGIGSTSTTSWATDAGGILTAARAAAIAAGATHVSIMLGANDAAAHISAATYKSNLQTIANAFIADGKKVMINYPPYIQAGANGGATDVAATENMRSYLAQIDSLVDNVNYLQGDKIAYNWFMDHQNEVQADGTHMLEAGHQSLASMQARAFDRAVLQVSASGTVPTRRRPSRGRN